MFSDTLTESIPQYVKDYFRILFCSDLSVIRYQRFEIRVCGGGRREKFLYLISFYILKLYQNGKVMDIVLQ